MSSTGPMCKMCGHRTRDTADCRCRHCFAPVLCDRSQINLIKWRKQQSQMIYQQVMFNFVKRMQNLFADQ